MTSPFSGSLRGGRTRKFKSEINVVPYIDVMLVLLVIFMVVAPIANPSVINLPTTGKTTQPPKEYIEVALKADTTLSVGIRAQQGGAQTSETVANRRALIAKLRILHEQNPEYPVLISADKDSKYDDVVQTITEAKKIGIERVALATR